MEILPKPVDETSVEMAPKRKPWRGPLVWIALHGILFAYAMSGVWLRGGDGGGAHVIFPGVAIFVVFFHVVRLVSRPFQLRLPGRAPSQAGSIQWVVAGLFSWTLWGATGDLSHHLLKRHLPGVEAAATPLIEAIEAFERDNGKPPVTTAALDPRYLTELPATTLPNSPIFTYERAPRLQMKSWSLAVRTFRGYYAFDGSDSRWRMVPDKF